MTAPIVVGHDLQSYTPGLRILAGSFATNGSSSPAAAGIKGVGFSVAFTSTGLYTVTLTAPLVDVTSLQVDRTEATQGTFLVSPTPYSTTTRTFTIRTTTPAAADTLSNVAAAANNRISFLLVGKTVKGTS